MTFLSVISSMAESLDLKISVVQATRDMFPSIHHIECGINPGGAFLCVGRGMARDESSAYHKAIGEALERYCVKSQAKYHHTNGIALHTDIELAKQKAYFELLERDAYICHHYTRTPFFTYQNLDLKETIYPSISEILRKNGVVMHIARLASSENLYISIAISMGVKENLNFGLKLGLGCSDNLCDSIDSAVLESMNFLPKLFRGRDFPVITYEEFLEKKSLAPRDYDALANNKQSVERIKPYLEFREDFQPTNFRPNVVFHNLAMPRALRDKGIYVVKALSRDCQELFFSTDYRQYLNQKRLAEFNQLNSRSLDIPLTPHFLA